LEALFPTSIWPEIWQATLDTPEHARGSIFFTIVLGLRWAACCF